MGNSSPTTRRSSADPQAVRSFTVTPLRGKNDSRRVHMDIDCRNCSFWVGEELVVDQGRLFDASVAQCTQ